ncbi:MAG: glycosyltransferase family 2 protein [Thermoleophilaceae bacterium]
MDAVVITHNSADDLRGLLECDPLRQAFPRLIVADSASSDGSPEMAERAGAEVVKLEENEGFGKAANVGMERTRGPVAAILNPDIRLPEPQALSPVTDHFSDPSVGVAAPSLVLPDGSLQDSAREVPTPIDLVRRRIGGETERGAVRAEHPVDAPWVVAAFCLVRKSAFERVGGFDEDFRLYFEDVDLCVRMRKQGFRVRLDPRSRVVHYHRGESRKSLTGWSTRQHVRSAFRFYRKHPTYAVGRRSNRKRGDR